MSDSSTHSSPDRQGPHIDGDLCLDLLHDLLPRAERERVVAHLRACPPCERTFREMFAERERLRAAKALRSLPDGELVTESRAETPRAAAPRDEGHGIWADLQAFFTRRRYRLALATAAVVVALLAVLWPRHPEIQPLQLGWLPASSEEIQSRGWMEGTDHESLLAGLEAYAERDLGRAIALLRNTQASGQMETIRRIYLGSALGWSGRHAEAAAALKGIAVRTLPDPWGAEARWTLYVALRESGQLAAADSLLRALSHEVGEIGERARAVRER